MIRRSVVLGAVLLGAAAIAQEVVTGSASEKGVPRPVVAIDPVPPGLLPVSERVRRLDLSTLETSAPAFMIHPDGGGVKMSGSMNQPTRGIFALLPDDLAQAAAGRAVMVTVTLAGNEGAALFAYAAAGDVTWRPVAVSPSGTTRSFDYGAAPGEGSWIGFLPDPEGTGQSVTVTEIKVEILD